MLTFMSSILITYIMALAAMAFFTLLERKALGYFQLRKGPNKVSFMGIPQPLADALKLFSKELSLPITSNFLPFIMSPLMGLILSLMLWVLFPSLSPLLFMKWGVIFFLIISSLSVYTTLGAGWTSNSKYALLGALRGVAQTISYEVSMSLILLSALIFLKSFNLNTYFESYMFSMMLLMPILMFMWFTTTLAETNRTPFDFAEGESELVSGFNTEYSAGTFAMIFMAEYMNIIIMSMITVLLFLSNLNAPALNLLVMTLKISFFAFVFIWCRGAFPRMRYDRLMSLTWKSFLPLSLMLLIFMPWFKI
uniref:NADH-ubiquinone oxidoreductase chain 1 n=1 Tax=Eusyllis blomstrandi TaxID=199554 RepID=A0A1C9UZB6_EUSBL|nr:NADH dehydrogenase subunit 1 [Eusyllis blomstrandi]AOR87110.1 NADH dehydrogenase subunit 1 [Eusyllis blomstrandi]